MEASELVFSLRAAFNTPVNPVPDPRVALRTRAAEELVRVRADALVRRWAADGARSCDLIEIRSDGFVPQMGAFQRELIVSDAETQLVGVVREMACIIFEAGLPVGTSLLVERRTVNRTASPEYDGDSDANEDHYYLLLRRA